MKPNKKTVDLKLKKASEGSNNDYEKINSSMNRVVY
jgi:hypothetical protein